MLSGPHEREIECLITGRVIGVMFRDFTQRQARVLSLRGTVENLSGGTVHVVAQGPEAELKQFVARLERGSLWSRVEKVETTWREPSTNFEGFKIIF